MQEICSTREDEIFNTIHQRHFKTWDQWLNQTLGWSDDSDKRHERIADIASVIFSNFSDKGYHLIIDKTTLFNKILVWAYTVDKEFYVHSSPYLTMDPPQHRDYQKDRDNYDYTFDAYTYWNSMCSWADHGPCNNLFATLNASSYFWANLPYFVYRFIDVTYSPFIMKYDEKDKMAEDEEIASLVEKGILFIDKKGRVISATLRDTLDE